MKQILQNLQNGETELADVPCPKISGESLLIRTSRSLVSAGTERMLVEFGNAGLIGKARQQPDKVRMVLEKVKTDGLAPTLDAVRNKLDQPLPLGYCNVGTVLEVRTGATGFTPGDRVASNGKHAQIVNVPRNLCARIPDNVDDETAAFTVIGAIALQGIRLAQPTLGEMVAVTGLGLIGLMAVQLLRAQGCRVIGIDLDPARLELAARFGAETIDISNGQDPVAAAISLSRGRGIDAVILTAASKSSEPVHQAANMCRKRGRIVLVGVTGLELSRADFFEKELTFQVSCSYGPGRHDPNYEDKGHDYPIGFVRWTGQRNFEAVLDMMADGRLDVMPLISHRFAIENAKQAYEVVAGSEPSLGILLEYAPPETIATETLLSRSIAFKATSSGSAPEARLAFIGSGNYATGVLIPAFKAAGANLAGVVSSSGVSSVHAGRKFGFKEASTDAEAILADPDIDAVIITTRHDSHACFVVAAIEAGKHVFVEKPLCLSLSELDDIISAYSAKVNSGAAPLLMLGFNRRFAPQIVKIKDLLSAQSEPKSFVMTVNAGAIPANHWTQDKEIGGGRIVGEACHFIDLLRFLADAPIISRSTITMDAPARDTASISLGFANGSIATIHYFANGPKSFPKERLEVFCSGAVLQLDNFRKLRGFGWPGFKKMNLSRQDKGQKTCAATFVNALRAGGPPPISFDEIIEVSRLSILLAAG